VNELEETALTFCTSEAKPLAAKDAFPEYRAVSVREPGAGRTAEKRAAPFAIFAVPSTVVPS